ncbi:conserved hypothetical protein [Haloferula helveola]|uniref:DUF4177 domain-containing protein n=1 Tax=Haloferula helveola TaxID=490095 RepID=A0ABN6H1D8_9BACT|nr:conserved hypothetical protein [Haloferula helveola]
MDAENSRWEHRSLVIETGGWGSRGVIQTSEVDARMNELGRDGFELVSAIPVSDGSVGTKRIALFFKRPAALGD